MTGDLKKRFNIDDDGMPHAIVSTLKEVAGCFGVSYKVVEQHWSQATPKRAHGRYDLAAIQRWKHAHPRDPGRLRETRTFQFALTEDGGLLGGDSASLVRINHIRAHAAAVLERERARKAKRENDLAEADILDRHQVERQLAW